MTVALLIPADDASPVREVEVGGLADLQALVGGFIESVPYAGRVDVVPYFNEEGKLLGLPVNARATRLLDLSLFAFDHVVGEVVLTGFNPETGDMVALPDDVAADVARRVGPSEWPALVAEAAGLDYSVELVEYVESADSPGLLGQGLGVCVYDKRVIRIRKALRDEDRCFVLRHELEHARHADADRAFHVALDRRFHAEHADRHREIADYLFPIPDERG